MSRTKLDKVRTHKARRAGRPNSRPPICPHCGASSRERVLLKLLSVLVFMAEVIHHRRLL
jgi:hypothetical protein